MATSYVQLLLLVLASLLFLPALCAVDFEYCNKNGYDYGNVSRVEISPNPVNPEEDYELSITVFGYASKRMENVTIQVWAKSKKTTHFYGDFYICKRGNACVIQSGLCLSKECPLEAGTNFKLPISGVGVEDPEGGFKYELSLHEDDVEHSVDYDEKLLERMCIDFVVPMSAPTLDSA